MESIHSTVVDLFIVWAVVTAILVGLIVYRGTIQIREDDQVFLDSSGDSKARDQLEIVTRIQKLGTPIKLLAILSVILFLVAGGARLYEGFQSF